MVWVVKRVQFGIEIFRKVEALLTNLVCQLECKTVINLARHQPSTQKIKLCFISFGTKTPQLPATVPGLYLVLGVASCKKIFSWRKFGSNKINYCNIFLIICRVHRQRPVPEVVQHPQIESCFIFICPQVLFVHRFALICILLPVWQPPQSASAFRHSFLLLNYEFNSWVVFQFGTTNK